MGFERTDWAREAALLRPAKLTVALFGEAPTLDVARPWVPDRLLPLYGGRGFESLTGVQRLCYNHAYARQILAEFTWAERYMIVAPLETICRTRRHDPDRSAVLHSFLSDERHHLESFFRIQEMATAADSRPAKVVLRPPQPIRAMVAIAARFPVKVSFWAAATEAFEQYTIKLGQSFHRDETVDPLFREIFVAHARDEARHCRLDTLIEGWLRVEGGAFWNAVNRRLLSAFDTAYRSVDWGLDGPLRDLAERHPEISAKIPHLLAEAKALRRSNPLPAASE
jgi:P-aminobenzoate N-oxygenase AurF